ncbi:MAG: hypothetical protein ACLGIV_13435 [Actinomycetes bacterium]
MSTPRIETTLRDVRRRRSELREAMDALEQALAAPASGREQQWVQRLNVALVELSNDLRDHVVLTESPDGLHASLVASAPRLAGPVSRLARDHSRLQRDVQDLLDLSGREDAENVVVELRSLGTSVLAELARHRQRGSDLVWEAYAVDIGGQE